MIILMMVIINVMMHGFILPHTLIFIYCVSCMQLVATDKLSMFTTYSRLLYMSGFVNA